MVQRFVLRGCLAAICRIRANILCIAKRFWDLMPLRRDQKLFPHLGEAGTAVFAVQEVEYGGHDLTSCLICTISSKLSFFRGPKMWTRSQPFPLELSPHHNDAAGSVRLWQPRDIVGSVFLRHELQATGQRDRIQARLIRATRCSSNRFLAYQ